MVQVSLPFLLNHGIRIAGAFQWAVLLVWIHRNAPRAVPALVLQAFSLSVVAYLLSPLVLTVPNPEWSRMTVIVLLFTAPYLLWLTAKALFDDDFRLTAGLITIGVLAEVVDLATFWASPWSPKYYGALSSFPSLVAGMRVLFPQLGTYVFLCLALWEARRDFRGDLVESRLRLRKNFVIATSLVAALIATSDIYTKFDRSRIQELNAISAAAVLVVGFLLSVHFSRRKSDLAFAGPPAPGPAPSAAGEPPPLDAHSTILLDQLLNTEKMFLRSSLDLEQLAEALHVPEYRLRRHINRELGYRNFRHFLNHYRVEEAKRILSSTDAIPIYNLALDLGFGSTVSFQRAFREATGISPSEFRAARRDGAREALDANRITRDE